MTVAFCGHKILDAVALVSDQEVVGNPHDDQVTHEPSPRTVITDVTVDLGRATLTPSPNRSYAIRRELLSNH